MPAQPLTSIILLAYNQEQFIREAVASVLSQTYSPLEVILSDDGSSDRTFDIIQEMTNAYCGPHKLILNRNEKNLGITEHFNRAMSLTAGEIVALAAGDDISLNNRILESVRVLQAHPDVTCVSFSQVTFSKEPPAMEAPDSHPLKLRIVTLDDFLNNDGAFLPAPSRAFRRFTHDYFGPLTPGSPSEDTASLFRCLLHGPGAEISMPGVYYRVHGNNSWSSANKFKTSIPNLLLELDNTLQTAANKQLIDEETHDELRQRIRTRMGKLQAVMDFERANYTLQAFVRCFLLSEHFTFRQKVKRLFRAARTFRLK